MHLATKDALLALQLFHVLFLSLHDWVPLGNLNDVKAVRAVNPGRRLLITTLISVIPYAFGVVASAIYHGRPYPTWLLGWLWVSYAVLFIGELGAWWIPYLLIPEPRALHAIGPCSAKHTPSCPSATASGRIRYT